ncbi:FAD-dependent oxidoreductase [Gordonia sp. PP30]|uniref:FAD-dependent oxidoreductase n=1 Tax=Gordonia sp. PP30 TaxID=2935861 RepID=UPI001FFFEE17|nr:FAD-dependent oxidoreductase [Gordonia sp. PP30]UQE75406.1 FAD-dependent oxidoreductase [Gordonia sp. PP30]
MPAKEGLNVERELTVVGGGAVGLTCALAAADAGWRVRVYDDGPARRAAHVAGGMLGCLGEAHPGEDGLLAASADSVARWPALLNRLGDPGVSTAADTLLVAGSAADRAYLDESVGFARARVPWAGGATTECTAADLRAAETGLTRTPAGGYRLSGEGAVDNRRLLTALRAALTEAGVRFHDTRVTGLAGLPGDQVLVTAGLDTSALIPGGLDGLRGEKGEILRLTRTSWSVPPPRHVIRARWHGRNVYLVPRPDGLVLGATQYEAVDAGDRAPQAGGVADLLGDACELFPGLRTYELTEVAAGIRPMSADGLPIVRRVDERTVVAAGHGRNGIALAPGTAVRVLRLLGNVVETQEERSDRWVRTASSS